MSPDDKIESNGLELDFVAFDEFNDSEDSYELDIFRCLHRYREFDDDEVLVGWWYVVHAYDNDINDLELINENILINGVQRQCSNFKISDNGELHIFVNI